MTIVTFQLRVSMRCFIAIPTFNEFLEILFTYYCNYSDCYDT